jgi:hypothetical protein
MKRALLVVVVAVGCKKHEAQPVPVPVTPPAKPVEHVSFRPTHTLTSRANGSAFEVTDGTGEFHITLPNQPTLSADMMEQSGVQVWNAQAVMPGTDVDVQFGAMAVPDGELPGDLSNLAGVPQQLATMTNGNLVKNEAGTLAGATAQIFELTTGDKRRLFGWYVFDRGHARVYQINCVGEDSDKTRTACGAVASSFTLTKR